MKAYELGLNLVPGGVRPRLNISQYDKGQTITCVLSNGNVPYTLEAGEAASVAGTKPDGTGFIYACTYDEDNRPVVTVTEQMTVVPGEVVCELVLVKGEGRQGTINFVLEVERAALDENAPISETDIPILEQMPEIVAEVEAAQALAEAWAVGSGSGADAPSDTNNAYYWAMQAASYAGGGLKPEVVAQLPTVNISTSTLYFVPSSDPSQSNFYDEYINIDGTSQGWELIGTTAVDLTDYYTKSEVNTAVGAVQDQVDAISGDAEEFDATKNYVIGMSCYKNGALWRFTAAHTGAWDIQDVELIDNPTMAANIATINTHLSNMDDSGTYNAGTFAAGETKITSTIAFNKTFVRPPVVSVDMSGGGSALNIQIINTTTTGISLMIQNNSGAAITNARVLTWRAIGLVSV